jgi:FAD/FMN-containing dehydrogenase
LDTFFERGERRNYWKSIYLERLDDDVLDFVIERAVDRPDPWTLVATWHLGGAAAEVEDGETAVGNRAAPWMFSLDTGWEEPAKDADCIRWTRDLWESMKAFSSSNGCYLNFPGRGEEGDALLRASYGEESYARLRRVKQKWDPDNYFRMNQNIVPESLD